MRNLPVDREIAAIVPAYSERGDGSLLYRRDGSCQRLPVKVETVLRALIERKCEDLHLLRKWAQGYTRVKLWAPLAISWELVLVPFKMRRPRVSGDATMGYCSFTQITELQVAGRQTILSLRSGQTLPVLWSFLTANEHLKNAFLMQAMMTNLLDDVILQRF